MLLQKCGVDRWRVGDPPCCKPAHSLLAALHVNDEICHVTAAILLLEVTQPLLTLLLSEGLRSPSPRYLLTLLLPQAKVTQPLAFLLPGVVQPHCCSNDYLCYAHKLQAGIIHTSQTQDSPTDIAPKTCPRQPVRTNPTLPLSLRVQAGMICWN